MRGQSGLTGIDPGKHLIGDIQVDASSLPEGLNLVYSSRDGLQLFGRVQEGEIVEWTATQRLETMFFELDQVDVSARRGCQGKGFVCVALGDGRYACMCA